MSIARRILSIITLRAYATPLVSPMRIPVKLPRFIFIHTKRSTARSIDELQAISWRGVVTSNVTQRRGPSSTLCSIGVRQRACAILLTPRPRGREPILRSGNHLRRLSGAYSQLPETHLSEKWPSGLRNCDSVHLINLASFGQAFNPWRHNAASVA
jgi:hypothetical protein